MGWLSGNSRECQVNIEGQMLFLWLRYVKNKVKSNILS